MTVERERIVSPTPSYSLRVPAGAEESVDERVVSYWIPGDDTLLQLSSYKRSTGDQVSARQRLHARLARGEFDRITEERVTLGGCADVAAASGRDTEGTHWLYVYAVWPDFMVLATVSNPISKPGVDSWALQALQSIQRRADMLPG